MRCEVRMICKRRCSRSPAGGVRPVGSPASIGEGSGGGRQFASLKDLDGLFNQIYGQGGRPSIASEVVERFFAQVMKRTDEAGLPSRERISVDGTLI